MKVLVACEFSGTVRDAFIKRGHDAISCDLLPSETPGPHLQGNVLEYLGPEWEWDLMIAHPPCTYLTNSGVSWLYKDINRWVNMFEGAKFFNALLSAEIPQIAIENPIPHKYALGYLPRKYSQIIQPWMFGHPETKATCLWLKNLPELQPTNIVKDEMMNLPKNLQQKKHYLPPSQDRWKLRSVIFQGIADAMAEQWGAPFTQEKAN